MVGDHGYDVRADMDLDSDVDATESSVQSSDSGQSLGLGNLSRDPTLSGGVGNRVGYAGYQWDPEASKFHVRHRVKDPLTGRWMRRDPIDLPPRFIPPTELV
jgi:RHS repeat-associated protein